MAMLTIAVAALRQSSRRGIVEVICLSKTEDFEDGCAYATGRADFTGGRDDWRWLGRSLTRFGARERQYRLEPGAAAGAQDRHSTPQILPDGLYAGNR